MPIKKHRRRLASGEEKVYTYSVSADGTERRSLSIRDSSVSPPLYRTHLGSLKPYAIAKTLGDR
jgi:hypothetical protein